MSAPSSTAAATWLSLASLGTNIVAVGALLYLTQRITRAQNQQQQQGLTSSYQQKQLTSGSTNGDSEDTSTFSNTTLPISHIDASSLSRIELGSESLRSLFLLDFSSATLLNHGSFGAIPRVVFDALTSLQRRVEHNPDLWYRLKEPLIVQDALDQFATYLKCDRESLAFVKNASSGVSLVLQSLGLKSGDVIVAADSTYNACKLAMRRTAQLIGAEYLEFALPIPVQSEEQVVEAYRVCLDRLLKDGKKVRFLLVDTISSPTAVLIPFERIARLARDRGIKCMVDAAAGIGCIDLGFQRFDYDYMVTNLHKWTYGPKGTALLYANAASRDSVHPFVTSHATNLSYRTRFLVQGTGNDNVAFISAVEGLNFTKIIGEKRSAEYTTQLLDLAVAQMTLRLPYSDEEMASVNREYSNSGSASTAASSATAKSSSSSFSPLFICPPSMRCPTMRLIRLPWRAPLDSTAAPALAVKIMSHFISHYQVVTVVIYEHHSNSFWLRLGAQVYNQPRDYDRLIVALLDYQKNPIKEHVGGVI